MAPHKEYEAGMSATISGPQKDYEAGMLSTPQGKGEKTLQDTQRQSVKMRL